MSKKVSCDKRKVGICGKEQCKHCFARSFASHEKAEFWSEKNKLKPFEVARGSNFSFIFICTVCLHDFSAILNNITKKKNPSWCPYCYNGPLCKNSDCKWCFEHSFACHEKAKFWSIENKAEDGTPLTPRDIRPSARGKYFFNCDCGHKFYSAISNVTREEGSWCSFCGSDSLCPKDEDCKWCFEHSFANHEKQDCWSETNELEAREVRICSGLKFLFRCKKCTREFKAKPVSVVSGRHWCPFCKNKTEGKIIDFIKELFPEIIYQFKAEWCRNSDTNKFLPFDFCVGKTIIELDGRQHYEQVSNWESPETIQSRDRFKEQQAIQNGYSVIRILQKDVWKDKIDWKSLLLKNIVDRETPIVLCLWE